MPQTKQQKRQKALEMAEANAKLTPEQKIAKLDHLLGPGNGAVRERARLAAQIEARKAKVVSASLDNADEGTGKLTKEQKEAKKKATAEAKAALKAAA